MNTAERCSTHVNVLRRRAPPRHKARAAERAGGRHQPNRQESNSAASVYGDATMTARRLAARLWRRLQNSIEVAVVATSSGIHHGAPVTVDEPSLQSVLGTYFESEIEAVTMWNPAPATTEQIYSSSEVSALKYELEQARARIRELEETRCCCSKEKLEHFWREALGYVRAEVDYGRTGKIMERANSRLVDELMEAKLSVKWLLQRYEAERKKRELTEELCREQAMKIKEAEVVSREFKRFFKEEEEEREMLRMAEAWQEERVQMKLLEAKLAFEEKYSQLSASVADLKRFLGSSGVGEEIRREGKELREAVKSVNINDMEEFSHEPHSSPNNVHPVLNKDTDYGENDATEIELVLVSSPASVLKNLNAITSHQCDGEDRQDDIVSESRADDTDRVRTWLIKASEMKWTRPSTLERPTRSSRSSQSTRDHRSISPEIQLKDSCYQKFLNKTHK